MTHCPHRDICPFRAMRAPDKAGMFNFEMPGLVGRLLKPRHYEQSVQVPTWGNTQPVVVQQPQRSIITGTVEPGEQRKAQTFRERDLGDVVTAGAWSLFAGVLVSGAVSCIAITQKWAWYIPTGAFFITTASLFLATSAPVFLRNEGIVTRLEEITRIDLNGDGRIGDIAVDLSAELPLAEKSTQHTHTKIPLVQLRAWRSFCRNVAGGNCNFSGNAAEEHGVARVLFDAIVQAWSSGDSQLNLVDPLTVGPRKTPKLINTGPDVVARHGTAPLPEIVTVLEQLTGDR